MINLPRLRTKTELEAVRTDLIAKLPADPQTDEYRKVMAHVEMLSQLIDKSSREKLSPNTIAVILGNVGIAGMVLYFERENVLNTKLFAFLGKPKS